MHAGAESSRHRSFGNASPARADQAPLLTQVPEPSCLDVAVQLCPADCATTPQPLKAKVKTLLLYEESAKEDDYGFSRLLIALHERAAVETDPEKLARLQESVRMVVASILDSVYR